jgi:NADPH:quinone reductase-like Zn-dependent oxidoreductase
MRAIVQPRYGPPESVELRDLPTPSPAAGEVLVRVRSSSVNAADVEVLDGYALVRMAAPFRPAHRIVGSDVAGIVADVGSGVDALAPGDEVMGDLSEHGYGAFAEYAVAPVAALCRLPAGLALADAGAVPSAAWVAIKAARLVEPGHHVLVNGAGGGMGTFAVQMAVARGARVTGVDSAAKLELVRSLGAHAAIDYATDDVIATDERYDLVLDVYARRSVSEWQRILTPTGRYRMAGGSTRQVLGGFLRGRTLSRAGGQELGLLMGWPQTQQDMDETNELIASGDVRPVIGQRFPLEQAAAALRQVKEGQSQGKVVIDVGP